MEEIEEINLLPGISCHARKCENTNCNRLFQVPNFGPGINVKYCRNQYCISDRKRKTARIEHTKNKSLVRENKKKHKGRQCTYMIFNGINHSRCKNYTGLNYYFCQTHHEKVSNSLSDLESFV
jgi:hypothetical protein